MSPLHSSKRPPPPLTDADYDHEINLVDHTAPNPTRSHSPSRPTNERDPSPAAVSVSSSRRDSSTPLQKHSTSLRVREELTRRKYSKYQDRHLGTATVDGRPESAGSEDNGGQLVEEGVDEGRGRSFESGNGGRPKKSSEPESVIDVLYENQRGGFLCGMALFSSKALGGLDAPPWTNVAQKPSATDITNAQVPDPSWFWVWKEWSINHDENVDRDGWEYSFAFSKKKIFSWHGPSWWNSFVRRRAWIRKRAKKSLENGNEVHLVDSNYLTIQPTEDQTRSRPSTMEGSDKNRYSAVSGYEGVVVGDIDDIDTLMKVLRFARIDREKTEAVENFIKHGGDDLYYLRDHMHEIMRMFIFQASRRSLLTHLIKIFNEASELQKENTGLEKDADPVKKRRLENLEAAVTHADEEVKRLEFWSDVKGMAESGETKGAADERQGWDKRWTGIDDSGPKDVVSDKKLPGRDTCVKDETNGEVNVSASEDGHGEAKE